MDVLPLHGRCGVRCSVLRRIRTITGLSPELFCCRFDPPLDTRELLSWEAGQQPLPLDVLDQALVILDGEVRKLELLAMPMRLRRPRQVKESGQQPYLIGG